MGSLYDRMNKQLGDDKSEGVTALDIANLPEKQQKIMFALLRDHTAATKGISLDTLQSKLKNPIEDLGVVVQELINEGWLIVSGEEESRQYRVNLRRKRGTSLGMGIFSTVISRLSDNPTDKG